MKNNNKQTKNTHERIALLLWRVQMPLKPHKLPLVMIGKSETPQCFKHVNKKALSLHCCEQRSVWMDGVIFFLSQWFHHGFVPAVKMHQRNGDVHVKALMFLVIAPLHLDASSLISDDGNLMAHCFFPRTQLFLRSLWTRVC